MSLRKLFKESFHFSNESTKKNGKTKCSPLENYFLKQPRASHAVSYHGTHCTATLHCCFKIKLDRDDLW